MPYAREARADLPPGGYARAMPWWAWLLLALAVTAALYAVFLLWLVLIGKRADPRAFATFIPDCIVLVSRLARDHRVPRRRKILLFALIGYLALPFDLAPDLILQLARPHERLVFSGRTRPK